MSIRIKFWRLLVTAAFLASCAHRPPAPASARVGEQLPDGEVTRNAATPPRETARSFGSPNRNLDARRATWHVRAALNVAALSCTGQGGATIRAGYNRILKEHRLAFTKALAAEQGRYRKIDGAEWLTKFDKDMTKLYNFFAQPAVKEDFCQAAVLVTNELAAFAPVGFIAHAATTLPRLDAPFAAAHGA